MSRTGPACRIALLISAFCIVLPFSFDAQQSDRIPQATAKPLVEELDLADRLAEQRQVEEARKIYEQSIKRARAEKDVVQEARALSGIGRILSFGGKYAEAQTYLEEAMALTEAVGDEWGTARVANSLGIVAENLGQSKDALSWYQRAVRSAEAARQPRTKAIALFNMARMGGTNPEGLSQLAQVVDIAREIGDRALEGNALQSWGERLFNEGDFAAAMERFESAVKLYTDAEDWDSLSAVYTSMGRLNRAHGQPQEAIPLYDKALQIQLKTGNKIGVIQSLNATGVAYDALHQFQRAREFYEKAYALALETKSPRVINFMRGNLAGNLVELGDYVRATQLLEELLQSGTESYPAVRHNQLAHAYLRMGRLPEAREHADKGIELSMKQPTILPRALLNRAEVREQQGDLPGALDDASEAMRIVEERRTKLVPLDFMKQGFSEYYQDGYTALIELYYKQGDARKALETAETARARAFLDLLATKQIRLKKSDESEVNDLRQAEQQLRAQGIDPSQPSADYRRPPPGDVSAEAKILLEKWTKARPEILSFVSAAPQTVQELAASARRLNSTILSYWRGDDCLYVWVVTSGGKVEMRRVEIALRRLISLVDNVTALGPGTPESGAATRGADGRLAVPSSVADWQELYRILIQPVRSLLPAGGRLTIIPHGPLLRLPFAALVDGRGRYLLEDHAIHYAPAGALLSFTSVPKRSAGETRHFLFVADPQLSPAAKGEPSLPKLPGARDEVRSIARLLPARAATVLEGTQADEQTVSASMSGAAVLHFATHGVTLDDQPLNSYLALGRSTSPAADGRLTAAKLYSLDLNADLVVLSSCRSGGGAVTGDGISALARAFFYAGAPAIIASVWNVPDRPSNRLLLAFYASWLRGKSRVDALRIAQLQLLADLRAGRVMVSTPAGELRLPEHPALWAGFILLGEP